MDLDELKIFHAGSATENLLFLKQLAECFGIKTAMVGVESGESLRAALGREIGDKGAGLVIDLKSLRSHLGTPEKLRETTDFLSGCAGSVLLLVMDGDEATSRALRGLTGESLSQVCDQPHAERVTFPNAGGSFSRELSSRTFPREARKALTLIMADPATVKPIMDLDGKPAFIHSRIRKADVFVWSTPQVFDIHRPLGAETEFELACDEYVPAIIFLRSTFGDRCWHNPKAGAGIVIDDPLLQKSYGFIDFESLLESARRNQYHITLAYIPWNQWRSRAGEIQLFLDHSDCFSICVHGCDHTKNEYGLADYQGLLRKNFVARERMDRHSRRTGLPCEPIMVCPQEKYSLEAMEAFSDSRQFLGVVCTACMPRNLLSPQLCGADLLLPAQDYFFGFPVFKRHYWGDLAVFAMALFLGKPAILVEHHEFFRNGPSGAEEFVRGLAKLRLGLRWKSLADTLTRTHAQRRVSRSRMEVRFFTDTFFCEHELEYPMDYHLVRRVPEATVVQRVLVNGKDVPFNRANGFLTFETHADRPQTLSIEVEVAPIRSTKAYSSGVKYQASVAVRRGLSELRDNVVARNRFALKAGRLLMKSFRQRVR